MKSEFEMSDLGELNYFLSIEFTKTKHGVVMHQTKYTGDLLKRFKMEHSNPVVTPVQAGLKLEPESDDEFVNATNYRRMVWSLRYLCNSRLDLSFSVGVISRYMQDPKESQMYVAKRILQYLQGTMGCRILFPNGQTNSELELVGYSDQIGVEIGVIGRVLLGISFSLEELQSHGTQLRNLWWLYLHVKLSILQLQEQVVKQSGWKWC